MADAVTSRYIYPPNWDGNYAATLQKNVPRRYILHLTNISDGTGESAVQKVDLSGFLAEDTKTTATVIVVEKVEYRVYGMSVSLIFDHTTDVTFAVLQGDGVVEWPGGLHDNGTGQTGDLLLTTTGHTSGDTYDITITFRVQ